MVIKCISKSLAEQHLPSHGPFHEYYRKEIKARESIPNIFPKLTILRKGNLFESMANPPCLERVKDQAKLDLAEKDKRKSQGWLPGFFPKIIALDYKN